MNPKLKTGLLIGGIVFTVAAISVGAYFIFHKKSTGESAEPDKEIDNDKGANLNEFEEPIDTITITTTPKGKG